MNTTKTTEKKPMSRTIIHKIMLYLTYLVSGVFLVKNIFLKDYLGLLAVGGCLLIFTIVLLVLKKLNKDIDTQRFVTAVGLIILVFIISQFSGQSSSDDFLLYFAVIALTGMFLRPRFTLTQVVLSSIVLFVQYFIHPEKAGAASQYFLCCGIYVLAGLLTYQVIKRGRAFIEQGKTRAEDAEHLLDTLKELGQELEQNVVSSSTGIDNLKETNARLNQNASDLLTGSVSITEGVQLVESTCDSVQGKMEATENQVTALTEGVKDFEKSLELNRRNMQEMAEQMHVVKTAMGEVNHVFQLLEQQMNVIYTVTEQLNKISSSTTMLALNASIEAARAGQSGAGFAVVASKVQDLAVDSNKCSEQVVNVVDKMQEQIQETTKQLEESDEAINTSLNTLQGLQEGFSQLTNNFGNLYQNIENQNDNIQEVNTIFETLKSDIAKMSNISLENQSSVEGIAQAMNAFKDNIDLMLQDTQQVYLMSSNLMDMTKQQ